MILLGAALILCAGVVLFALTAEPGSNRKAGTSGNAIEAEQESMLLTFRERLARFKSKGSRFEKLTANTHNKKAQGSLKSAALAAVSAVSQEVEDNKAAVKQVAEAKIAKAAWMNLNALTKNRESHTDVKTAKAIGFQGGDAFVYSSSTNKAKKITDTSEAMHSKTKDISKRADEVAKLKAELVAAELKDKAEHHTNTRTKQKMDKKMIKQSESLNSDDNVLVESATGKFKEVHGATARVLNQDMSAWLSL
jgi:hypothetical protein